MMEKILEKESVMLSMIVPVCNAERYLRQCIDSILAQDCSDDFDKVIRRIIELDQNDDLYLKMLRKPVFKNKKYVESFNEELSSFIHNIFDQPLEQAYRRSKVYAPKKHEGYILTLKMTRNHLFSGRKIPDITDKQLIHFIILSVKRIIKTSIKHSIRKVRKLYRNDLIKL